MSPSYTIIMKNTKHTIRKWIGAGLVGLTLLTNPSGKVAEFIALGPASLYKEHPKISTPEQIRAYLRGFFEERFDTYGTHPPASTSYLNRDMYELTRQNQIESLDRYQRNFYETDKNKDNKISYREAFNRLIK